MGSPQSVVRSLLATALLLAATPAQQPPHVVTGKAIDELGQPLAGVEVRLLPKWCPEFSTFASSALQAEPLPRGRSDAEGRWTLAIPWPLLTFASGDDGMFVLEATLAGRQSWRELVPPPLGLWRGDDVALPPLRDQDLATIRVEAPQPGMLLCVERVGSSDCYTDGAPRPERQVLAVPRGGQLSVHVPLLPNPIAINPSTILRPIGWQARLLFPGRCSGAIAVEPGAVVGFSVPKPPAPSRPVARSDRQPVRNLRVLLQVNLDDLRWLPVTGSEVPVDEASPPLAVIADGCTAIPFGDDLTLTPLAGGPRTLRIATPAGEPAREFEATWAPLRAALALQPGQSVRGSRLLRHDGADIELPDAAAEPGMLQLRAPGCAPERLFDPRGKNAPEVLHLQRESQASLSVLVLDDAGRPVPAALVEVTTFADNCMRPWEPPGRALSLTGPDGTLRCDGVPLGDNLQVQARAPGYRRGGEYGLTITAEGATVTLHLQRLSTWRIRTVDAAGAVVPFAAIGCEAWTRTEGGSEGTSWPLLSNARGEAVLQIAAVPPPALAQGLFGSFAEHRQKLSPDAPDCTLKVARRPLVMVRAPAFGEFLGCALTWQRRHLGASSGLYGEQSGLARALLLEWPQDLQSCQLDLPQGPPLRVRQEDLTPGAALVELDRRAIRRRLPLRLLGDAPADLHDLRAPLRGLRDRTLAGFGADSVAIAADGSPSLVTRDDGACELWLLHPQSVPVALILPAATDGATEVAATMLRGAPLRCTVKLPQPLHWLDQVLFEVETTGLFGKQVCMCRLLDPALAAAKAGEKLTLQAPFALPPGKLRVSLRSDRGACQKTIEVVGTAPLDIDFGEW